MRQHEDLGDVDHDEDGPAPRECAACGEERQDVTYSRHFDERLCVRCADDRNERAWAMHQQRMASGEGPLTIAELYREAMAHRKVS